MELLHLVVVSLILATFSTGHAFISSDRGGGEIQIPALPPAANGLLRRDAASDQDFITALLQSNAAWAANVISANATFFPSTATSQHPEILWIGCSDSRVPETTILGLEPGDVFTTRTVANVIQQDDLSTQAVLDVGVTKLKTKHLILCGHTNCGGVNLALGNEPLPPALAAWLAPLRVLRMRYSAELNGLTSEQASLRLTQLNVLQGVQLLRQNATVAAAMAKNGLVVHGMIYDVGTGLLTELDTSTPT